MDVGPEQRERWRRAAKSVIPWGELQPEDYHFQWAKDDKLIDAGCAYEYARESHKFRCWFILTDDRRRRKHPGPTLIEFKDSSRGFTWLTLSGWERWLRVFTDELIANKSFAHLLRANPNKLRESLDDLPSHSGYPKAVELPGRHVNYPRSQIVEVQIFWRYRNEEIGKEMGQLAKKLRPDEWKEPQRRGRGKATSVVALLDALSAMRLRSHYPKRGTANAVDKFDNVRLGKIAGVPIYSDLDEYAGRARQQFAVLFPFGEPPMNSITWAQRQSRKQ